MNKFCFALMMFLCAAATYAQTEPPEQKKKPAGLGEAKGIFPTPIVQLPTAIPSVFNSIFTVSIP